MLQISRKESDIKRSPNCKMGKQKRNFVICAAVSFLLVVGFVVTAVVSKAPAGSERMITADGGEIVAIERAEGNDLYCGTDSGFVQRIGNAPYATKLGDLRIYFLADSEAGLIAVDETQNMYVLDTEGNVLRSMTLPGLFVNADYYNGEYYIAMTTNYSDLYVYCYDSSFHLQRSGKLYLYNADTMEMEAATVSVYALYVRNGQIYIFTDLGQIFISPVSLEGLTSDEDKYAQSGATVVQMERPLKSVAVNDGKEIFYLAAKNGGLYTFDYTANELSERLMVFESEVAMLSYSDTNDLIYVFYDLYNTVTVVDAQKFKEVDEFRGVFNLANAEVSGSGEYLFTVYREDGAYKLKSYDLAKVRTVELVSVLKTVSWILAALSAVVFIVSVCLLVRLERSGKQIEFRKIGREIWRHKFIYIVLFPSIVLLFLFCYYPSVSSMIMAFFDYRSGYPVIFNGVDNFRVLFANPMIGDAVRNMLLFLVSDIVLGLIPPILFAWSLSVMNHKKISSAARILLFIPGIIPGVAGFLIWKDGIYGPYGLLNTIIKAAGGDPIAFLGNVKYSMASLILMGFPYVGSYLIFYGAISNIPQAYYEAAELEGCGVWKRILHIDLPFISPQIKYVFVMSFIGSVQNVGRVMMTTQGAAGTQIPIYIMYNYLSDNNYGVSSAMALILFAVLMIATVFNLKIRTADTEA